MGRSRAAPALYYKILRRNNREGSVQKDKVLGYSPTHPRSSTPHHLPPLPTQIRKQPWARSLRARSTPASRRPRGSKPTPRSLCRGSSPGVRPETRPHRPIPRARHLPCKNILSAKLRSLDKKSAVAFSAWKKKQIHSTLSLQQKQPVTSDGPGSHFSLQKKL